MSATRPGRMPGTEWRRWSAVGSLKKASSPLFLIRRSGAATYLALIAITGMLLIGAGCNTWGAGSGSASSIRPSPLETSRLMSNAQYYKLMGRPEAALKEMEQAHWADPDNLKIVDLLAQNYQELGQFQRAQDLYREALTRRGSHPAIENNFCFSYYLQGNLSKAEACFKEALERDPGNTAARNNLALVWCRQGRLAEAQRLWEEAEGPAGAQDRMNQALALLGKAPANYAKLPESKPQPQAAIPPKPAAPVSVMSAAKPEPAKAPASVPVAPVQAESKVAAKPMEAKPLSGPQAAVAPKPADLKVSAVPELKPAPIPASAVVAPARADAKIAAKPAKSNPISQLQPVAAPKPTAPVRVAALAKHEQAQVEAPPAKIEPKAAVKPAELKPVPVHPAVASQPAAPVTVMSPVKPEPAKAQGPVAIAPARANAKIAAKPAKSKPISQLKPAAAPKPAAPVRVAAVAKPEPTPIATAPAKGYLTAEELITTAIEIRNGTGTRHLARDTRTMLSTEGFNVELIGNHIDFGAEFTVIYFRPEAERVAMALNSKMFPGAILTPDSEINHGMAIKIVLGRDFLEPPRLMSCLTAQ